MDNDFKSPNSHIDRPMAPKFKTRGRRAANCSSGCTSMKGNCSDVDKCTVSNCEYMEMNGLEWIRMDLNVFEWI